MLRTLLHSTRGQLNGTQGSRDYKTVSIKLTKVVLFGSLYERGRGGGIVYADISSCDISINLLANKYQSQNSRTSMSVDIDKIFIYNYSYINMPSK